MTTLLWPPHGDGAQRALLDLIGALQAHDYARANALLERKLVNGIPVVADLVEGLLGVAEEAKRAAGIDDTLTAERAQGYVYALPTVEAAIDAAIAELGKPELMWQEDNGDVGARWADGSLLAFARGPSGLRWRDATADAASKLAAEDQLRAAARELLEGLGEPVPGPGEVVIADSTTGSVVETVGPPAEPPPVVRTTPEGVIDHEAFARASLAALRKQIALDLAQRGTEGEGGNGNCILCGKPFRGEPVLALCEPGQQSAAGVGHADCAYSLAQSAAKPATAEEVKVAGAALHRAQVEARARAAAEEALARQDWPRSVWEELLEIQPTPARGLERCTWCSCPIHGMARRRPRDPALPGNPELVVHVSPECAQVATGRQQGIYGTRAEMETWLRAQGCKVPEGVRFAGLEAAVLIYRRARDVVEIPWAEKPRRTAKRGPKDGCSLCGGAIAAGQVYLDGGVNKRAHLGCAGVAA